MMDLAALIKDIGIPCAMLVIVMWKVVLPVTDSHLALVRSLKESTEQLALSHKSLTEMVNNSTEQLTLNQKNLSDTLNTMSKTIDILEKKIGNKDK